LKVFHLKGDPHDLALGMSFGVFFSMMPIIPFHTAFSIAMALLFKCSKITAALGVWVSNPFTFLAITLLNYKIGATLLGVSFDIESIHLYGEGMALFKALLHSGSTFIFTLLLGGLVMGILAAVPSYFIFLILFQRIKIFREKRRKDKIGKDKTNKSKNSIPS
jgi:uncharacterized protein (DUF2062 family)